MICFTSNAQLRERNNIEIIPRIGYSNSIYRYDTSSPSQLMNSLSSTNFGIAGDYYFNNRWSLRSGLLFQAMESSDGVFTDKLNYLNIPVNANWLSGVQENGT